jgi:pimeloyl-ACP methyl ester carboxylesterase
MWDKGLAFKDSGIGLPVVFLHPTPLNHQYWWPIVRELKGVHAIVPDLRGHGDSPLGGALLEGGFDLVPDAPVLSMAQHARDVLHTMDRLGFEGAVFVGCSIGGYVMLELWRQDPGRVRAMAFVCSKPQADAPDGRRKRADTIAKVRAEGVTGLFDAQAQAMVGTSTRESRPEIAEELRGQMLSAADSIVAIQAGLATRPDSLQTVSTIEAPVLAIAGGEDVAVSPAEMEAFLGAPGGCELHMLPNAGHFAAYEQPMKVGAILSVWMERIR